MAAKKKTKGTASEVVGSSDPKARLDGGFLLANAQGILRELEADLLARARASKGVREALTARHAQEKAERRTADPLDVWERQFVTQVAASWVLSCVFVRTLEDRGLLGRARIAGPGALDSQKLFFEMAPSLTEREYLLTVFRELARLPAATALFDARHNPVWLLGPSAEVAKKLLAMFRSPSADAPSLRFGQLDTRFLGDLYQDLSADVRARYALLQTPRFVERYILDRTLERAIDRFGVDETTVIDPTCGSGHFLLGAFERLLDHRIRKEPGTEMREAARRALDAVYGADINPYAVAVARFRLTLAFLEKTGYPRIIDAPALPLHLVVADSLLHNPHVAQTKLENLEGQSAKVWGGEELGLEDEVAARDVLHRKFAAVVGNPPYITVKDAVLRERYRAMYPKSAAGKYSVAAPFTERFFQLAKSGGFVGMITANSFMKREFGKKLIEEYLPTVNIDGIVNTSGAYIPGHGTPTVLLFGSAEEEQGADVLTVLAKRGEPSTPEAAERGLVWSSIAEHGGERGFENDYIGVAAIARTTLRKHPWSLGGGGASELKALLEECTELRLDDLADSIGIASFTLEDDVFLQPPDAWLRLGVPPGRLRPMVMGEAIRDWAIGDGPAAFFPYDERFTPIPPNDPSLNALWPYRTNLANNMLFGGKTKIEGGLRWYEFGRLTADKLRTPLTITFAEVASHNHFVLDRGGKVFNRTAPIIKLKADATEEDHLVILAYLNSSTACFFLRQVCHQKQMMGGDGIRIVERAKVPFQFAGHPVATLPVPNLSSEVKQALASMARRMEVLIGEAAALSANAVPLDEASAALLEAEQRRENLLEEQVGLQEQIDWEVYAAFGLVQRQQPWPLGPLSVGARPFEVARGRTLGTPVNIDGFPLPTKAPDPQIAALLSLTSENECLRVLENPEYKRRWVGRQGLFNHARSGFGESARATARADALSGLERAGFSDHILAASTLMRRASDIAVTSVLDAADLRTESVPFLAAYRHTAAGLEKRDEWERVWGLQRAVDRGAHVPTFDPPPKYDQKDYRDPSFWRLRGKLDVPKERFISYPGCESNQDKEPSYGWAGWNKLQQAQALAALYQKRKTDESWGKELLTPILAGILELLQWVKQWHNEPSAEFGGLRLGDYFETFLDGECHHFGLTRDDLVAWRPPEKKKGGKAAAAPSAPPEVDTDGEATAKVPRRPRGKQAAKVAGATSAEPSDTAED